MKLRFGCLAALALVSCGGGGPQNPALTDAQQVWCGGNVSRVLAAAETLGMTPVDQVRSDDVPSSPQPAADLDRAIRNIGEAVRQAEEWFARYNSAPGRWPRYSSYPMGTGNQVVWYADKDYSRACRAAYDSR